MTARSTKPLKHILHVYVSDDCAPCARALELAQWAEDAFPKLDVKVVDISRTGAVTSAGVTATPTYVLDGEVIHLGNPPQEWLFDRLT